MKSLFLLLTLLGSLFIGVFPLNVYAESTPDVFVGVDIAYGDVDDVKQLADTVSSYTNLVVLGCTGVTQNRPKLEEACQYLFDKGLYFIVYQEYPLDYSWLSTSKADWLETAKARWGNKFLGIYYTDEVGGRQLDHVSGWMTVKKAENYTDANSQFNASVNDAVNWFRNSYSSGNDVSLFTSDYALYWFDYQAGFDVVLAQFGWNYSRQLNVGLCRGAATALDREWGAMITWTYTKPPYIESGAELYADLMLAYDNGAKYIVVFDSNQGYTSSILEKEHLDALKEFWNYFQVNPRKAYSINERTAYVLPKDYAFGFRGPDDKIWGLWEADTLSTPLSIDLSGVLQKFDSRLDIVYEDALGLINKQEYRGVIYWNNSETFSATPSLSPPSSVDETEPFSPFESKLHNALHFISSMFLLIVAAALAVVVGVLVFVRVKRSQR